MFGNFTTLCMKGLNNLMKFTWEITKTRFFHDRGKLFEKQQNGKNLAKRKNNL